MSTISLKKSPIFRYIAVTVLVTFAGLPTVPPSYAQVAIVMPPVGQMVHITSHFEPPQMVGLKIDIKNPFSFGFIMDQGQNPMSDATKKEEFNKIIKYFLVSLAMPNKDMWVNLSPYESKRIIPEVFGQTEMGRDLLAQDYILKQFTASLMYPEEGLGKKFWDSVYAQAQRRFGTTDINVNTFNKVWIVADHADVYQKGDTAFLVGSHLKVMLEQDYMAIESNKEQFGDVSAMPDNSNDAKTQMASQLVREIIIPAIEKEVNEGQSFAAVRQIYNAEIMATWFKKTLRESLLGQVFADKSRIAGQKVSDPQAKEKIFLQYLKAYKQGVFNYIKREVTPDGQTIPRRYLSGGVVPLKEENIDAIKPVDIKEPTQAEIASRVQGLTVQFGQAQGPEEYRTAVESQFANSSLGNGTPSDLIKPIANMPVSPDVRDMFVARITTHLTMPNASDAEREAQVQKFLEELNQLKTQGENEKVTFQSFLNRTLSNVNPSVPIAPAMARAIAEIPQLSKSPSKTAELVNHFVTHKNEELAAEVKDTEEKVLRKAPDEFLVTDNFVPAQEQQTTPVGQTNISNSLATSIGKIQERLSGLIKQQTQAPQVSPYVPLYTAHMDQLPALVSQGEPAVRQYVAPLMPSGGNLEEAIQGIMAIGRAQAEAEARANTELKSTVPMVPESMVKPLAQMMARQMIHQAVTTTSENETNNLAAMIGKIQESLSGVIKQQTQAPNVSPYVPLYTAHMDQLPALVSQGEPAVRQYVAPLMPSGGNLEEAIQGIKVIQQAHTAALDSATQQLNSMVPVEMVQPLAEMMVKQAITQEANKNIGGINLSDEHLTMNIKLDGAGMPLSPQYQDRALMNLNGLVSVIRSIIPISNENVPALYELAK